MTTLKLSEIERATLVFAAERRKLADIVQDLNDRIEKLKKEKLPEIRKAVNATAEKRSTLKTLVESAKDVFVRPRTLIFGGVKVGFQKGRGILDWDDDAQVVKMIKKVCPDQADILIKTVEKPVLSALNKLDTATLRKLGFEVSDTGDQVVIKPTDSGVEKIVKALLKEAEEESD